MGFPEAEESDYKEMLQQTIAYITTLEEKNRNWQGISGLENEVSSLKKQQEMPETTRSQSSMRGWQSLKRRM